MSVFMFLASDKPLKEVKSSYEGDLNKIEISNNMYYSTSYAKDYSDKKYFSGLHWISAKLSAGQFINYLKEQLEVLNEIEIWNMWLESYGLASIKSVHISEVNINDFEFLDGSADTPICLIVKK
ncbi:hypothetical protein KQI41_01800 [Tissierella pigra]|uniref:Uncharacterized protein n=1 Tax=Tissierella pigra TaxID=2607614 RepID=A0A6N7Y2G5_9FIRM|nr:hypothetical protein [Tissierella pigra]MBU5425132.1 hypothetical protein [Tissierella pigra]MSU02945.1 hypothetical protein [Tissierella pigra]